MRIGDFILEFLSSRLCLGLVLLVGAAAWWFGLFWFLETILGWDPRAAYLVALLLRGTGAAVMGIAGAILVVADLTD